jgi:hypothetical protein
MQAYTQPLRNLRYRIAPLGDLMHRVSFEIVAVTTSTHDGLLASKLGKKASKNLGAIQNQYRPRMWNKQDGVSA